MLTVTQLGSGFSSGYVIPLEGRGRCLSECDAKSPQLHSRRRRHVDQAFRRGDNLIEENSNRQDAKLREGNKNPNLAVSFAPSSRSFAPSRLYFFAQRQTFARPARTLPGHCARLVQVAAGSAFPGVPG
jgi:hypothetical protein